MAATLPTSASRSPLSSPHCICHSCDPSPSSPSPESRTWYFPGPSSRFHKREHNTRLHTRADSTSGPSAAPILSTAQRATHRRTRSLAPASSPSAIAWSPSAREPASQRSAVRRLASYPAHRSTTIMSPARPDPVTPAKNFHPSTRRTSFKLQDSPFSDYFTDDGRSTTTKDDPGYTQPGPETQRLLVRLSKLQSQLIRTGSGDEEEDASMVNIIERRLNEMEHEFAALHSQTRMPPELEDSGLFLEDEDEGEKTLLGLGVSPTPPLAAPLREDSVVEDPDVAVTPEQKQAEYDYLLLEAQNVLASVTKAERALRQRQQELKALNDAQISQIQTRDDQIFELASENESLRADLESDHSELLFLKLQFKALAVEADVLEDAAGEDEPLKSAKREVLAAEMQEWRDDWQHLNRRMGRRRDRYAVSAAQTWTDGMLESELDATADDERDWQLETIKKTNGSGKVQSITIRRLSFSGRETEHDCAITTSSEADSIEDVEADRPRSKRARTSSVYHSAWQELWDGLVNLAGMGEGRF